MLDDTSTIGARPCLGLGGFEGGPCRPRHSLQGNATQLFNAAFREAFAVPAYTDFLEFNRKAWPEFLLARGRYEEALHAAQELTKSEWPLPRLAGHTLAGEALLASDRSNEAQDELSLAEQETEQLTVNLVATSPFPSILRAGLLLRDKKTEQGEALLQDIVKMILARPGPDAWSAARFELARTHQQVGLGERHGIFEVCGSSETRVQR